jgi:hypothetical protein
VGESLAPIVLAVGAERPMVVFLGRPATPPAASPLTVGAVKVAYLGPHGFRPPLAISPADQQVRGIATAVGLDRAIVTWIHSDPPSYFGGTVFAAASAPGGRTFGSPEQVSPEGDVLSALVTSNPASVSISAIAPWTVAWTGRPNGGTKTVVRSVFGLTRRGADASRRPPQIDSGIISIAPQGHSSTQMPQPLQ